MKIFLDDVRPAPEGWTRTHTVGETEFFLLMEAGKVEVLSLDHDLGEDNMTGYDLMCMIEEWAALDDWHMVPQSFEIHSANPVGRKNMQAAIDSIERMRCAE